jgi:precorrin-6B methylase 2
MPEEQNVPNWLNERILKIIKEHWSIILNIVLAYALVQVVKYSIQQAEKNDEKDDIIRKIVQDNEKVWRETAFRSLKLVEKHGDENSPNTDSVHSN